jgi:NifU-like protein involved in Fe-S cluster formation
MINDIVANDVGGIGDESLLQLYNRELMTLSAQVDEPKSLPQAGARATSISLICGSEVTVELSLKEGRVVDFGYAVDACSLTKAVVATMAHAAIGKSRPEIAAAGTELKDMLDKKAPPPSGDWAALKILEPVIDYKARHESIMLPFDAVEKAFSSI